MIRWNVIIRVQAESPTSWRTYPTGLAIGISPCGQYAYYRTTGVYARILRGAYAASHGIEATLDAIADALFEDAAPVWANGSQWSPAKESEQ